MSLRSIVKIPIRKLKLLDKNPRTITKEQFEKLCDSIKEDPDYFSDRPCLVSEVDGVMTVYAGNQRVRAAKQLGWKDVPCIVEKDLPPDVISSRILKDNKTYGDFDFDILANLYEIDTLLAAGFTADELVGAVQDIEVIETEDEEEEGIDPVKDEDAVTKLGDLYELNGHRLVCGDSTLPEYVNKCLNGNEPILMVTDPPYGVEYKPEERNSAKGTHGAVRAKGKVLNDNIAAWALAYFLFPGSIAYVWHASLKSPIVHADLVNCGFEVVGNIIWAKQHFTLGRSDYHWKHEPCWYAVRKGHNHNWKSDRKQTTVWEIANLNCFGKSKEDGEERTAHSTQKPIECMARPIRNNTEENDGVYDPFLGSGTTLIAAEKLKRNCYGIELSPAYCDIIVNRWKSWMIKNNRPFTIKHNGQKIE